MNKSPIYQLQLGVRYTHKQVGYSIMVVSIEGETCTVKRLNGIEEKLVSGIRVNQIINNYYQIV